MRRVLCHRHFRKVHLRRNFHIIADRVPRRTVQRLQKRRRRAREMDAVALVTFRQKILHKVLSLRHLSGRQRVDAGIPHKRRNGVRGFQRVVGFFDPRALCDRKQRLLLLAVRHHILLHGKVRVITALRFRHVFRLDGVARRIAPAVVPPAAGPDEILLRLRYARLLVRIGRDRLVRPCVRRDALVRHGVQDPHDAVRRSLPIAERFHGIPFAAVPLRRAPAAVFVCAVGMCPQKIGSLPCVDGKQLRVVVFTVAGVREIDVFRISHAHPGHHGVRDRADAVGKPVPTRIRRDRIEVLLRENRKQNESERQKRRCKAHKQRASARCFALAKSVSQQRVSEVHARQQHRPDRRLQIGIHERRQQHRQRDQKRQQDRLAADQRKRKDHAVDCGNDHQKQRQRRFGVLNLRGGVRQRLHIEQLAERFRHGIEQPVHTGHGALADPLHAERAQHDHAGQKQRAEAEAVARNIHPERQQQRGKHAERNQRHKRKPDLIRRHRGADGRDHTACNRNGIRDSRKNDLSPLHDRASFFGSIL